MDSRSVAPVEKNQEVTVEIFGLSHDGEGVGRAEGFTLFVQGALPGETVRAKVMKVKKQYGYAKLLEIQVPSAERTEAPCPIYKQCGGCQLQHMTYEAQLVHKRQQVVDSLERIGKLQVAGFVTKKDERAGDVVDAAAVDVNVQTESNEQGSGEANVRTENNDYGSGEAGIIVHPTLGMQDPWRYRNKAQVPFGMEEGGLVGGFYAQGSHRIVDMEACLIQHEQNDDVVRQVKEIGRSLGVRAYDETSGSGLLRHVVVKYGFATGEVMVVLVTNGDRIPRVDEWIEGIRAAVPGVQSICQNVNTARTNVIFGGVTRVLWGRDVIHDTIGDVKFAISARSFYQVNPVQTEVLYGKALQYAALSGRETVIDAYCGIGTITLFLAQHAKHVYGVEIVPEAIDDARGNSLLNGITNATFAVGKAEEVIPAWKQQGIAADVVVVDPPRKGCDAVLLDTLLAMRPERIVYVSCNPATLARDLRVLADGGYIVAEVTPVDMFPHTVHVECVALLVRQD
ncbi:RNA methyltransferase [Paenibacillus swuensis]|uniref:RNA methyltransferase n=1 Tax=Paenibacillus swuensis TaxID=1178515 RepID=A0A172TP27_9BACL|nr:RNA methyltransferase [Paenibacillus swuensis]